MKQLEEYIADWCAGKEVNDQTLGYLVTHAFKENSIIHAKNRDGTDVYMMVVSADSIASVMIISNNSCRVLNVLSWEKLKDCNEACYQLCNFFRYYDIIDVKEFADNVPAALQCLIDNTYSTGELTLNNI